MRLTTAVLACAAITLTGCSGDNAPASPPTPSEPLSTSSPTTVDTDVETVTTTAQPPADPVETTATADGPPEMPDEAREDSEAGAEAFALHYIDLINYTGMHPEVGLLEPLAADSCESCANHEASVAYGAEHGDHLKGDTFVPGGPAGMFDPAGPTAVVRVPVEQPAQAYFVDDDAIDRQLSHEEATLVFRMSWSDRWRVDEITVDQ